MSVATTGGMAGSAPTASVRQGTRDRRRRRSRLAGKVVLVAVLAVGAALMLFPLLWVISTAVGTTGSLATGRLLPQTLTLANFRYIFRQASSGVPVARWMVNSLVIASVVSLSVAFIDSLAAFALSRLQFAGRSIVFGLILSSLVVPFIATLVPLYLEFEHVHLLNTYAPLFLPYLANSFGVFLLYQFFKGVPQELQDAAVVDGAGKFALWRRVFMPLSSGVVTTLIVLTFMSTYNDFFWPLVAVSSPKLRTITVGIDLATTGQFATNFTALMALTLFSIVPMIVVFLFAQRRLVEGIALNGIGGT